MATKRAAAKLPEIASLSVDYPLQDEKIVSETYAFRVRAPAGARKVDISIDQGPWRPCREAVGFWWHDWYGYDSGEHEIIARVTLEDGGISMSRPHEFFVELGR